MLQMKQRTRINYTDEQKALMWERWQNGDSNQERECERRCIFGGRPGSHKSGSAWRK
jgi:hypothetical protein